MSELNANAISAVASAGVTQIIDVVDQTSQKAVEAVIALEDAGVVTVSGVVRVGDTTFDAAMAEVENSRAAFIAALRKVAEAVVAPINALS